MEDFFRWTVRGMTPAGLWPLPNRPLAEFWKLSIGHINSFFEICVIAAAINQTVEYYVNVLSIAETILVVNTNILIIVKNSTFLYRRDFVRKLLTIIHDLSENTPLSNLDQRTIVTTLKWKNRTYRMVKFLWAMYVATSFIYLVIPTVLLFQGIRELPYPIILPYDTTQMKYFIPTYIIQCYTDISMVFIFCGIESFFASVVMFVCSRIELLQYSIDAATEEAITKKKTTPLFGICLEYHKKILKVCEMLQDLYSFNLIVQFFGSTFCICTICFLIIQGDSDMKFKYAPFLFSLLVQLFIYCSFGQLLENQFESLGVNWHHNDWYNAPVSYQKDIKFYWAQCLRPVTFTAYKMMAVNVQTFFTICKTAVSYIAILQRLQVRETQ